jgi:hypothetical protein
VDLLSQKEDGWSAGGAADADGGSVWESNPPEPGSPGSRRI